jgi:opacity protein-like surface antigen
MKVPNRGRRAVALLYGLVALTVHGVQGQTAVASEQKPAAPSTAAEKTSEAHPQKFAIGLRARILPVRAFSVMDNGQVLNTTTVSKVNYDSNYNTVSHSLMVGGGLTLEARISRRTLVTAELLFNRLRYDKTTDVYSGTNDPTTAADERSHQITTENTKARLFDLPVLVHRNVRSSGWLSHFYVAGGATARLATTVRTTNNITNADATKANNQIPAGVDKRTLIGATVGAGFRFVDEFNIKVTPEVRYTRWNGMTFNQDSTRSPRNQLEVGIGFSR